MDEHDADCDKIQDYTDGIFFACLCNARNMNTICAANFVHRRTKYKPIFTVEIKMKESDNPSREGKG